MNDELSNENLNSEDENQQFSAEVDFSFFINSVKRNLKKILLFTFGASLISITYSLSASKIWKGEFQIVLSRSFFKNHLGLHQEVTYNPGKFLF